MKNEAHEALCHNPNNVKHVRTKAIHTLPKQGLCKGLIFSFAGLAAVHLNYHYSQVEMKNQQVCKILFYQNNVSFAEQEMLQYSL